MDDEKIDISEPKVIYGLEFKVSKGDKHITESIAFGTTGNRKGLYITEEEYEWVMAAFTKFLMDKKLIRTNNKK